MILNQYGKENYFNQQNQTQINEDHLGRVIASYGYGFKVITNDGEIQATLDSKLIKTNHTPAVGDFVLLNKIDQGTILIHEILPRFSKMSRKVAGQEVIEQVFATNFDYVFIFSSLNKDFNVRKIERYLIAAYDSGATPVIILSKADLCDDLEEKITQVEQVAPFVPIHPISSIEGEGIEELNPYFQPGKTIVLFGSSGVGKSTLINTLANEEILKVKEVREGDDRGRHTTTHRELFKLPNDSMIVDTPGIRELALWKTDSIDDVFSEIQALAQNCKFNDCKHQKEPGCAVQEALNTNELDIKRYQNYLKLKKEARYIEAKTNQKARMEDKKWGKDLAKFRKQKNTEIY